MFNFKFLFSFAIFLISNSSSANQCVTDSQETVFEKHKLDRIDQLMQKTTTPDLKNEYRNAISALKSKSKKFSVLMVPPLLTGLVFAGDNDASSAPNWNKDIQSKYDSINLLRAEANLLGFVEPDILDPHFFKPETLKSDEGILILSFSSAKDKTGASKIFESRINALQKRNYKNVVIWDLSDSSLHTVRSTILNEQKIKPLPSKIKLVLISAHGLPEVIAVGETQWPMYLGELAHNLKDTKVTERFDNSTHIYFNSCFLAAKPRGVKEVERFAKIALPQGSKVTVNRFEGNAGGKYARFSSFVRLADQEPLYMFSEVLSSRYKLYQESQISSPLYILLPQQFTYTRK